MGFHQGVKLAKGCPGDRSGFCRGGFSPGGGLLVEPLAQLASDDGDQGITRSLGEGLEFGRLGCRLALSFEAQAQQLSPEVVDQGVVAAMTRQAEAAAHLQSQQVAGHPAVQQGVELGGEAIEIVVLAEMEGQVVPAEAAGGGDRHLRQAPPAGLHQQHLAPLVGDSLIEAIRLRGAAVPGAGADLPQVMPVAEGDVVDLGLGELLQIEPIAAPSRAVRFGFVVPAAKTPHPAMGQHDAGFVARQARPVQGADPGAGVVAVAAAQQGTGQ